MLLLLAACDGPDNGASLQPVGPETAERSRRPDGGVSAPIPLKAIDEATEAERDESVTAAVSAVPADADRPDARAADAADEQEAATATPAPETNDSNDATDTTPAEEASATPALPPRIDPAALFIGAAPVPQTALSREFAAALHEIRVAMRRRSFPAIRDHLQSAAALRRSEADRQAYERMLLVHALWTQGWAHAAAAFGTLAPGDRIDMWAEPAVVEDKTDGEIMLRIKGTPQTFSTQLGNMPVRLAAALVEHRARVTGLALDAQAAALWTFAPEARGDTQDPLKAAQEALIEAAQRGAYVDHLIAELLIRRSERSRAP